FCKFSEVLIFAESNFVVPDAAFVFSHGMLNAGNPARIRWCYGISSVRMNRLVNIRYAIGQDV
ncbi:hypothetical protein ABTM15_20025, partial [Acinetobacter baumannii]